MNISARMIDLHVHTNFSDGTFSPEEVVDYALKSGLAAIAITDHDCVDAIAPAQQAAQGKNIEIVPGVELSAEIGEFEIHLVGLLIEWDDPEFNRQLLQIRQARLGRMRKMIEKLNARGINIDLADVLALCSRQDTAVGRLHLARALLDKGVVKTAREAFDRFIGRNAPCYEKRMIISPAQAIGMIRDLKGIPVFAHPGNLGHDEVIPELLRCGLMGIEIQHIDHSQSAAMRYQKIAQKHGLLLSGGSDCHGDGKGVPLMGMVNVPYEFLDKLRQAKQKTYYAD